MLRRVLLGFVGVVLVLAAAVVGAFAGWGYLTFANAGSLRYDLGTIVPGPGESAIVVDVDRFGASIPYLDAIGVTQLAVRSAQPDGAATTVFVGAGSTADVDAFVKGAPYAVALRDASGWQVRQIPGSAALPPTEGTAWLAQANGTTALLDVPTTRPLTIAVTRPDGAPVGAVALAADFAVPTAQTWAMWMGIGAAVALILGIVLLVLAFRRRRPRGAHEAGTAVATADEAAVVPMADAAAIGPATPAVPEPVPALDAAPTAEPTADVPAEPTTQSADEPSAPVAQTPEAAEPDAAEPDAAEPNADVPAEPSTEALAEPVADAPAADPAPLPTAPPPPAETPPAETPPAEPVQPTLLDETAELPVVAPQPAAPDDPGTDEHQPT